MRLYLDTSVFGGYFDDEFSKWSTKLFEEIFDGQHTLVISNITLSELEKAPMNVRELYDEIPEKYIEYVMLNDESEKLAQHYFEEGIISKKSFMDANHIAIATVNRVEVLISWNFKHMVNLIRIRSYNSVNLKYGYQLIDIRNPLEVIKDE